MFMCITKHGMQLISRVGTISKWPPHWMYYNLHAYSSHKEVLFAYTNTYQMFFSVTNSVTNSKLKSGFDHGRLHVIVTSNVRELSTASLLMSVHVQLLVRHLCVSHAYIHDMYVT